MKKPAKAKAQAKRKSKVKVRVENTSDYLGQDEWTWEMADVRRLCDYIKSETWFGTRSACIRAARRFWAQFGVKVEVVG